MLWSQGSELLRSLESNQPSRSFGTPASGHLLEGKRLPIAGKNFSAYSRTGALLGRTHVDRRVRDTVVEAYQMLERNYPSGDYQYAETGWSNGGQFRPHKSHQNGMSVDFLLPVRKENESVALSCWPWNLFCYGLHFDAQGRLGSLELDRAAAIAHLRALASAAPRHGLKIAVVILDESLRDRLLEEPSGSGLDRIVRFNSLKPWIKHDQHYHVDFTPMETP